jgi:hypothetical protein
LDFLSPPSPVPLSASKVWIGPQDPSRWELVTLVALGAACTAGALTFPSSPGAAVQAEANALLAAYNASTGKIC